MSFMRIVTYNILSPWHAVKWNTPEGFVETPEGKKCNWPVRKDWIRTNLLQSKFSIACLQEYSGKTTIDLNEKKFKFAGISNHYSDREESVHGVVIIYCARKVRLIAAKVFQSLVVPNQKGHRGEVIADFADKKTQTTVRVASVHLKGYKVDEPNYDTKQQSKFEGFKQLQEVMIKIEQNTQGIDHLFIAGDFNEDDKEIKQPWSRHDLLMKAGYRCDCSLVPTENRTGRRIDWIFHKPLIINLPTKLLPIIVEKLNPVASDHLLTGSDLVQTEPQKKDDK